MNNKIWFQSLDKDEYFSTEGHIMSDEENCVEIDALFGVLDNGEEIIKSSSPTSPIKSGDMVMTRPDKESRFRVGRTYKVSEQRSAWHVWKFVMCLETRIDRLHHEDSRMLCMSLIVDECDRMNNIGHQLDGFTEIRYISTKTRSTSNVIVYNPTSIPSSILFADHNCFYVSMSRGIWQQRELQKHLTEIEKGSKKSVVKDFYPHLGEWHFVVICPRSCITPVDAEQSVFEIHSLMHKQRNPPQTYAVWDLYDIGRIMKESLDKTLLYDLMFNPRILKRRMQDKINSGRSIDE